MRVMVRRNGPAGFPQLFHDAVRARQADCQCRPGQGWDSIRTWTEKVSLLCRATLAA
jgi:hypothetical protein